MQSVDNVEHDVCMKFCEKYIRDEKIDTSLLRQMTDFKSLTNNTIFDLYDQVASNVREERRLVCEKAVLILAARVDSNSVVFSFPIELVSLVFKGFAGVTKPNVLSSKDFFFQKPMSELAVNVCYIAAISDNNMYREILKQKIEYYCNKLEGKFYARCGM
jgi:hypothetical protein